MSFKVGDEVFIVRRRFSGGRDQLTDISKDKIKTITEKRGEIKLESSPSIFKEDGTLKERGGYSQFDTRLELWSSDLNQEVRKLRVCNAVRRITDDKIHKMDGDDLIDLDEILKRLFPKDAS